MMIEERLREMLVERGMWDNQANEVIERTKELKGNESMTGRWQHDLEGYLPSILSVLWLSVQGVALEYIDANCPQAWFRGMFTDCAVKPRHFNGSGCKARFTFHALDKF